MSDVDQLSAEESAAVEEMMADDGIEDAEIVEEPKPEPEPEAEPEEKQPEFKSTREKPPEGYVPHQAMHEERMKRQEAERRLAEFERMAQEMQARQQAEAQRAQEPQWVDPLIDPEGFKRYQDHQLQQLQQQVMGQQQAMRRRMVHEQRLQEASRAETEFRQEAPDYDDAVKHVAEARAAELRMYGLDDAAIQRQIMQDSNAIFDSAKRLNMNPAKLIYQLAQQRGYQAKAVQDEQSRVVALAEAQRQTQGLGSGGSRTSGRLTATQIAEMSEAEIAKLPPDELARAFGG